ncbi:MAG: glucose-1-phosphate adenylyltransferase [Gammaproteobacteria bacterium]|nr:glucose-1-phosphate adenylyltransferase [Gammaproteobacteria bacterium]
MGIISQRRAVAASLRDTLAVIMAGGRGLRLGPLTANHSKPALPFGGKFRIIDFTLSNCVNSGLYKICILTQYRAHSLMRHVELGWSFSRHEFGEFVELLPAQERTEASSWYQGTADAVYQNLDIILGHQPDYVLILAGDHIYKMDYGMMLETHLASRADVTVGCVEVPVNEAHQFGIMVVDEQNCIKGFQEKPDHPMPTPGRPGIALASMGIYLFSTPLLDGALERDAMVASSSHDFGRDIIPSLLRSHRLIACPFNNLQSGEQSYWRDVGTVDAYWEANLELIGVTPPLNLYDQDWPIRTAPNQYPPAKFVFDDDDRRGTAVDSMVSAGCIISGSSVRHSLLSDNVRVHSFSHIEDSVLLPGAEVGRHCRIARTIIDSGCRIPERTIIGEDLAEDRKRLFVTPRGVRLVCPGMLPLPVGDATTAGAPADPAVTRC